MTGTVAQVNATLAANVTYAPATNYNGSDTLTMTSNDLGHTGSGGPLADTDLVAITVTAVNDPPVNTVPGAQSTNEDTTKIITGLSVSDIDASPDTITVTLSVGHGTLNVGAGAPTITGAGTATVTLTGTAAQINASLSGNNVTYTPTANFNGGDTLTMNTDDLGHNGSGGALTDTNTVAITIVSVNDAPAGTNNTVTFNEDTSYTFSAADFGFTDPNDSPANALAAVRIATLPTAGTLTDNGIAVTLGQFVTLADITGGHLVFTPAANANGAGYSSFTFQVQDNGGISNGGVDLDGSANSLTLNVTAVDDGPVNTVPAAQNITYNASQSIIGLSVADVDSGTDSISVTLSVAHGTLVVSGGGASIAGSGTAAVTLTGSATQINTTLGSNVTYTPTTNFNGGDTLTMVSNDQGHNGTGGPLTDTDTVALNVMPVHATNDVWIISSSTPATLPGIALLGNDTDSTGQGLHVVSVTGPATLNPDGTISITTGASLTPTSFDYTVANQSGAIVHFVGQRTRQCEWHRRARHIGGREWKGHTDRGERQRHPARRWGQRHTGRRRRNRSARFFR